MGRGRPHADTVAEVEHFLALQLGPAQIATRLGVKPGSVARALQRSNRPDLAGPFEREAWRVRVDRVHAACADCGDPITPYREHCRSCAAWHRENPGHPSRDAPNRRRSSTTRSTQKAAA